MTLAQDYFVEQALHHPCCTRSAATACVQVSAQVAILYTDPVRQLSLSEAAYLHRDHAL